MLRRQPGPLPFFFCSLVGPQVLHGHADLAQDPTPQRAVILVVELLKLRCLPDLVQERHIDVRLQEQQQRRHSDKEDAHHHGDKTGQAEQTGVHPLVGGEQAQAAPQDAACVRPGGLAGAFIGLVALPLGRQSRLNLGVGVELPQHPGRALDRVREEQVDAALAVLNGGGQHAGTGAADARQKTYSPMSQTLEQMEEVA